MATTRPQPGLTRAGPFPSRLPSASTPDSITQIARAPGHGGPRPRVGLRDLGALEIHKNPQVAVTVVGARRKA